MLKIWSGTFGKEFYRQHAGLFLFLIYMIFGAVEPGQMLSYNLTLLLAICSSPIILSAFLFIIFLYALKSFLFIRQKLTLPAYQFVTVSCAADKKIQLQNWLGLYVLICGPILTYSAFLIIISIVNALYWSAMIICIYIIALLTGLALLTYKMINYSFTSKASQINISLPALRKPYWTWPFYFLLKIQPLQLIACKVLSLILYKVLIWMFDYAAQDLRGYMIALLAVVITHSVLISTVLKFEKSQLAFQMSFPISIWSRFLQPAFFYLLLLLPEFLLYINLSGYSIFSALAGILFCISALLIIRLSLIFF